MYQYTITFNEVDYNIKSGDRVVCKETLKMDNGEVAFIEGKSYLSESDGTLDSELGPGHELYDWKYAFTKTHHPVEKCSCETCESVKNKIKKGDRFICTSDVVMDDGDTTYRAGVIYTSHNNECITDDNGERLHYWSYDNEDDDNWVDYFQRYEDCGRVRPDKDYFQSMQEEYGREPGHVGVYEGTELLISHECDALKELLISKNRAYGDSALKNGVLFDISPVEAIKARINDKAMRIKNVGLNDSTEDTLQDIMGYMVLLRIAIKQQQI